MVIFFIVSPWVTMIAGEHPAIWYLALLNYSINSNFFILKDYKQSTGYQESIVSGLLGSMPAITSSGNRTYKEISI